MLSVKPPDVEHADIEVTRLTRHFQDAGVWPKDRPFLFKLRGLGEAEFKNLVEQSERDPTRKEREDGARGPIRDMDKLNMLMLTRAMVRPSLTDPGLLSRCGPTPERVIQSWFAAGEIAQLAGQVNNLSGWGEDAVVRAKKSSRPVETLSS